MYLHGFVDSTMYEPLSRWDLLILPTVWTQADLLEIRRRNPAIKIFQYVCAYCMQSPPNTADPWAVESHDYAANNDLWWYTSEKRVASDWPGTLMANITELGYSGPEGTWDDYMVQRIEDLLVERPALDGVFLDQFWKRISWNLNNLRLDSDCNPTHNLAGCDGVVDSPAYADSLWNRAMRKLASEVRRRFDALETGRQRPLAILSNGSTDYFTWLNGTMRELFPDGFGQGEPGNPYGYDWNIEMFQIPGGYLNAPFTSDPYRVMVINSGWTGTNDEPDRTPDFERHKRFTLVSTLLGDGYYSLDASAEMGGHGALWWEPEFDHAGAGRGYLGEPRGAMYRIVVPTGVEMIQNGDFSDGKSFWSQLATDATGSFDVLGGEFHTSPAAARVVVSEVANPGANYKVWQGGLRIQADTAYTLSFWARASHPQNILVHIYSEECPGNHCLDTQSFDLTTEWREHELSFVPRGASSAAGLDLFVLESGVVWFDDVSLREGDSNVFRRDFENGAVLLNYTANVHTVDLGGDYQRLDIPGSTVFDGAELQSETVPPWDARILLVTSTKNGGGDPPPATPLARLEVKQNEPNPFNPATQIRFKLPEPDHVELAVFDIAGRLVQTLVSAPLEADTEHVVTWNGKDRFNRPVRSGIYFYRIQTSTQSKTRKMTLLR